MTEATTTPKPRRGRRPKSDITAQGVDAPATPITTTEQEDGSAAARKNDGGVLDTPATDRATQLAHAELLLATGRVQAMDFVRKIVTVSQIRIAQELLDSNKFIGLPVPDALISRLGRDTVSSRDEYCQAYFNCSLRSMQRNIQYLETVGEDNYEIAHEMKLGHRDIASLAKLQSDERRQVLESDAFKNGNLSEIRATVKTFLVAQEEIELGHQQEREKLVDEIEEAKEAAARAEKTIKIKDQMLEDKQNALNRQEEELHRLRSLDPNDQEAAAADWNRLAGERLNEDALRLEAGVQGLRVTIQKITEHRDTSPEILDRCADATREIVVALQRIQDEYQLHADDAAMDVDEWANQADLLHPGEPANA